MTQRRILKCGKKDAERDESTMRLVATGTNQDLLNFRESSEYDETRSTHGRLPVFDISFVAFACVCAPRSFVTVRESL